MPDPQKLRSNVRMASSLLDILAQAGEPVAHAKALEAMGGDIVSIKGASAPISAAALEGAFRSLDGRRRLARRVGRDLVATEHVGAFLYYAGLATVEKSYRRCDQLLARETEAGEYAALEIGDGHACIAYRPQGAPVQVLSGEAWSDAFCGAREGMLEALPLSYGLLPAAVRETQCVGRGAEECRFDVYFGATSRKGALLGAGAAGALCVGSGAAAFLIAPGLVMAPSVAAISLLAGMVVTATAALAGRSFDLSRQLECVAGARRGHLALLDQTDQRIAEKMDELGKMEAAVESSRTAGGAMGPAGRGHPAHEETDAREDHLRIVRASEEIYAALGPLQRGLGEIRRELREALPASAAAKAEARVPQDWREEILDALESCTEQSRRLQSIGAELARSGLEVGKLRRATSLAEVVSRAIESLGAELPRGVEMAADLSDNLPLVRCEPFQIEQVVYQLLRNAAAATPTHGTFQVTLHGQPGGIELVVADPGAGISAEALDAVFDPFALEADASSGSGLGLSICYRVVKEHNGEMSISSAEGEGTHVRIVLPADLLGSDASPE